MSNLASNHCMRHFEEPYVAHCRTCNRPFCGRCLVFAFGPDRPPYCIGCALTASGVRNKGLKAPAAVEPKVDKRDERYRKREERRAAKADAKAAKAAAKAAAAPPAAAARTSNVPAPEHLVMPAARYAPTSADQPVA